MLVILEVQKASKLCFLQLRNTVRIEYFPVAAEYLVSCLKNPFNRYILRGFQSTRKNPNGLMK